MSPLIVCDNLIIATKLRSALAQHGHECPSSRVVTLDAAGEAVRTVSPEPDVVFVVIGDDQGRSEEALRSVRVLTRPRIVAIGSREPSRILGAVRAGADDYLDELSLHEELAASLGRITAAAERTTPTGHVTVVLAGSGGSGRTTLAVNLAVLAAKRHGKSVLLDFDVRTGAAAAMLDVKPRHTLSDLCRSLGKLDRKMFDQSLVVHESGVHLLPSPEPPDVGQEVTADGITRILRLARSAFSRVLVDLNDVHAASSKQLVQQASTILLVSRLDFAAIHNARRTADLLQQVGVPTEKVRFIVSRSGQPNELPIARVEQVLGLKVFEQVPDDPKSINLATNCGRPCVLEDSQTRFSRAVTCIADRLESSDESPARERSSERPSAVPRTAAAPRFSMSGWLKPLLQAPTG